MLVKSRWKFAQGKKSAPVFLKALGIDYRIVRGQDFWYSNRFILRELYREMIAEARDRLHELHPDKGGDGYEFDAFVQALSQAKTAFSRNLNQSPQQDAPAIQAIGRRGLSVIGFYRHGKVLQAIELIREGHTYREVARELNMSKVTVGRIRRIILGPIKGCPCGKPSGHKGWCSHMMKRSLGRQQLLARWHQQQKGRPSNRPRKQVGVAVSEIVR